MWWWNVNENAEEIEKHHDLDDDFFNLSEFNKSVEEDENFDGSDDEIYFAGLSHVF